MSRRTIDEHVRAHYEALEPSPGLAARLRDTAALSTPAARNRRPYWAAAAAALLLAAVLPWLGDVGVGDVADEIAWNHQKALAAEFSVRDPAELSELMGRLDFAPTWSPRLDDRGLRLVGSRYCSLDGQLAAQLILEDPQGARWTLYEASDRGELGALANGAYASRGVQIEIWREGDVLFGLASGARAATGP